VAPIVDDFYSKISAEQDKENSEPIQEPSVKAQPSPPAAREPLKDILTKLK